MLNFGKRLSMKYADKHSFVNKYEKKILVSKSLAKIWPNCGWESHALTASLLCLCLLLWAYCLALAWCTTPFSPANSFIPRNKTTTVACGLIKQQKKGAERKRVGKNEGQRPPGPLLAEDINTRSQRVELSYADIRLTVSRICVKHIRQKWEHISQNIARLSKKIVWPVMYFTQG